MAMNKIIEHLISNADILIEALPYIQRLKGKTIVIKYGGNAMLNEELTQKILQDITLLKFVGMNPIVVHGGGPDINQMLKALKVESSFHNGLRITSGETMDVVQMVLTGRINKDITAKINVLGGKALGLCGKDANLLQVVKKPPVDGVDLGYVGEIVGVNTELLKLLCEDDYIPVIAPVGCGPDGQSYNINADTVAGEIAARMGAEKVMFLTDVDGIRMDPHDPDSLIFHTTIPEIRELIETGIICGGMIPKVEGCIKAIEAGVSRAHILDGTIPHPIVLEIFTDTGIGTMITRTQEDL